MLIVNKNIFECFFKILSSLLLRPILKSNISPNFVTISGGVIGILGCLLLLSENFYIGLIGIFLIYIYATLDLLDGELARIKKLVSLRGEFLDITFDKFIEALLLIFLIISSEMEERNSASVLGILFFTSQFFMLLTKYFNSFNSQITKKKKALKTNELPNNINKIRNLISFLFLHLSIGHSTIVFLIPLNLVFNIKYMIETITGLLILTIFLSLRQSFISLRKS